MDLKLYQMDTLHTLDAFLQDAKIHGVSQAYKTHAIDNESNIYAQKPYIPIGGLENTPQVCIRIPTGGGKTILASHAVKIASAYVERDYPVVLWLVPTDTIRTQTVEALKNPSHPYRRALDAQFGGTAHVRIFDIDDYTQIRPTDLDSSVSIIVGTVQALRISDKNQRKVYAHNENLEPHFTHIAPTGDMDMRDDGGVRFSFFNLMKHHRPVMILDEGHRFKSKLSEDLIRDLNPSLVLEFTATPTGKKNVLVSVPATTLRDEHMIKMPIRLASASDWQGAVNGAIAKRHDLEKIAKHKNENIRPIVLFQAENKDKDVTVDVLKQHLIDTESIPEQKIAIATGDQRELDGITIMDANCPIEYIITVQALKEGWDCPYAYIFCSVANIQNSTDIEQLLGRVLRMPFATRRSDEALNCAYAYTPETTQFAQSAQRLVDKLVDMGFEDSEAETMVEHERLFTDDTPADITVDIPVSDDFTLDILGENATDFAQIIDAPNTPKHIRIIGVVPSETQAIIATKIMGDKHDKQHFTNCMRLSSKHHAKLQSPASKNIPFVPIPQLLLDYGAGVYPVTPEIFIEAEQWNPLDYDYLIEFHVNTTQQHIYTIDIGDNNTIEIHPEEQYTSTLFAIPDGWTKQALTVWLEKRLQGHTGHLISQPKLVEYIGRNVDNLDLDIPILGRCRHQLLETLKRKLLHTQDTARKNAMDTYLFAPNARVEVGNPFTFDISYNPAQQYHGSYQFKHHYYGVIANMNNEELEVAKVLDTHKDIKFWIRNLEKGYGYKLPLHNGNFYPDFVAELNDGRIVVVEHKGAHIDNTPETDAKNRIGDFWAEKTGNVFIMTRNTDTSAPIYTQIDNAIS